MFRRRPDNDPTVGSPSLLARPVTGSIRPPSSTYTNTTTTTNNNSIISRQQHIESYLRDSTLAPSTRKVSDGKKSKINHEAFHWFSIWMMCDWQYPFFSSLSDDSTFDTVFQSVAGDTLILRVHWPAVFATTNPPTMTLAGVEATHAWLDSRMRVVGYKPLTDMTLWKQSKITLGAAVLAVVQHLQIHPPHIVRFVDPGLVAIQSKQPPKQQQQHTQPPSSNILSRFSNNRRTTRNNSPPPAYESMQKTSAAATIEPNIPDIELPTIPKSFPELEGLTREQLERMLSDELELRAFCNRSLNFSSQLQTIQNRQLDENASTAQTHMDKYQNSLQTLDEQVRKLVAELEAHIQSFRELERQQDALCQPPPYTRVRKDLAKAKKEAFEESEQIAEEWLSQSPAMATESLELFLKQFLATRNIHHVRAAKLEVLEQQQQRRNTQLYR